MTASGGATPYHYSIDSITFQSSNKFICIPSGFYHAIVRDANGCMNSSNITLTGTALPLDLLSFDALPNKSNVKIQWTTANEEQIDSFAVEKMKDGATWQLVGRVLSKPYTVGLLQYKLNDLFPYKGWSYYRLKIIETAGMLRYTDPKAVYFGSEAPVVVYPNPATWQVVIAVPHLVNPTIKVMNAVGAQMDLSYTSVGNKLILNTKSLSDGIYFFELSVGKFIYSGSFNIQNNP